MFIARAKQPVFDTALKLTEVIVGATELDLTLVKAMCLVMPDGRIYWGQSDSEFVEQARDHWEKDLTEEQIRMYSIPSIMITACTVWMYPRDFAQVKSAF